MNSRRTLILVAAIVIGVVAGLGLLNYVRGIEDDIASEKQSVPVLVAAQDIPQGTSAEEAFLLMTEAQVPLELRPATYVPVESQERLSGLVAQSTIVAGQIIIDGLFVDPTVIQTRFADQIPSGNVAITLSIDQVAAVAGFVQPGDEVNLLVTHENLACGEEEGAADGDEAYCTFTQPARYVFQRLEVLAVGATQQGVASTTTAEDPAAANPLLSGPITFSVPNQAAQLLASVAEGDVILTLLPEDYAAEPLPALTIDELTGPTPAEVASCLTPYGPDGFIAGDAVDGDDTEEAAAEHFVCSELFG